MSGVSKAYRTDPNQFMSPEVYQERRNFFERQPPAQQRQGGAVQQRQDAAVQQPEDQEDPNKPIHNARSGSLFGSRGLNKDDKALVDLIYSGAVRADKTKEAGRGYMGLATRDGRTVPVKFMTHAKERYCGFRSDRQLMNEIENYNTQASQNAFDSSRHLEHVLLKLAEKVNRMDVVADIISAYKSRAASNLNQALLSRKTVFDALMAIKSGADKYGTTPLDFNVDRTIANSRLAAASTSVKGRNWNGFQVENDRDVITRDFRKAEKYRSDRRSLDNAFNVVVKFFEQKAVQDFNDAMLKDWTKSVRDAKDEIRRARDPDAKAKARAKAKAAPPKTVDVKDLQNFLVDMLMVLRESGKNQDAITTESLLASIPMTKDEEKNWLKVIIDNELAAKVKHVFTQTFRGELPNA